MSKPHFKIVEVTKGGMVTFRLKELQNKYWKTIGTPQSTALECEALMRVVIADRLPPTKETIAEYDQNGHLITKGE